MRLSWSILNTVMSSARHSARTSLYFLPHFSKRTTVQVQSRRGTMSVRITTPGVDSNQYTAALLMSWGSRGRSVSSNIGSASTRSTSCL